MASQVRILHLIKMLYKDHTVDFVTYINSQKQLEESKAKLEGICHNFYPILVPNRKENRTPLLWIKL